MSAQEVHAAVLAAVEEAERVEAAGTPGPWDLEPDEGGVTDVMSGPADVCTADDHDAALIVASRNAWSATLALVRLVLKGYGPCRCGCDRDTWKPDCHYRAAAAVVGIEVTP